MKIPALIRRKKKLRASTARRSLAMPEMAYQEMPEPNMKLSRALLIVLVLHVVAVAGIIAFNTIKTRQGSLPPSDAAKKAITKTEEVPPVDPPAVAVTEPATARREEVKTSHLAVQAAVKEERKTEHAKSGMRNSVADSGKTYVVVKGDNPVTIARKLKVSYDDLLALNHIEDPRKLQIGQKLLIPAKTTRAKKSDD
jgi:LysM repeat protein